MIENYQTLEKVRKQKKNLLVGFLFPEGDIHELQLTMRFFQTKDLFLEYFVGRPDKEFIEAIKAIQKQDTAGMTGVLAQVSETLIQQANLFSFHFAASNWQQDWNDFLEALIEDIEDFFINDKLLNDWDGYQATRIKVLGVGLLFGMIRHPYRTNYEATQELEFAIGKMILLADERELEMILYSKNSRHFQNYKRVIDYYPGIEGLQSFFDAELLAELGFEANEIAFGLIEQHPELEAWVYDAFQVLAGWFNWSHYRTQSYDSLYTS